MRFDTNTTLIAICTIIAVLGLQVLFFWLRDRRASWLGWYAAAFIDGSATVAVYLIPQAGHEFLLFGFGNAARILAFAFLWHGARSFVGRRPEHLVVVAALSVWLAFCSIPAFLESMESRVVVASLFICLFCGLSAFELWRNRAEPLPSQLPATITYISFAGIAVLRVLVVDIAPFPVGGQPPNALWLAGFGLVVFMHATFFAAFTLSMTRERRELAQRRYALSDPLTGLFNRRAFLDEAARAKRRRKGGREPVAVLVLDLDHFKSVNDRHGHDAGDQVLQHFAAVARGATRASDLLYRMGGEEFCFVLPQTTLADARAVAERIRTRFAGSAVLKDGAPISATVSIGIAAVEHAGFNLELLLAAGDAAVYEAKRRGRNQTVVADAAALTTRAPRSLRAAVA
jgi:diguanylate cyclase (GGDEF)-like protein